jgi:hypothetical protein
MLRVCRGSAIMTQKALSNGMILEEEGGDAATKPRATPESIRSGSW